MTDTGIDTSRTIEFHASPARLLTLLVFSVMSTGIAAALALRLYPSMPNDPATVIGRLFRAWSSSASAPRVAIWRLIGQRGAMVTVSPAGLRDVRVAAEPIPWRAIKSISTWQMQRQMVLVVAVDPAVEAGLTLTRLARWTRSVQPQARRRRSGRLRPRPEGRATRPCSTHAGTTGRRGGTRLKGVPPAGHPGYAPPSRQHKHRDDTPS